MEFQFTIELSKKEIDLLKKLTIVDEEGMFEIDYDDFELDELKTYNLLIKKGIILEYEELIMKFQTLTIIGLQIYKSI